MDTPPIPRTPGTEHPSPLLALPAELLHQILSYLPALTLTHLALTSQHLSTATADEQLWRPLCETPARTPIPTPSPLPTYRALYAAIHPHWNLIEKRVWFSDAEPHGKVVLVRYDARRQVIEGFGLSATRGPHTFQFWERDREVIVHSFEPRVRLDLDRPVLKVEWDSGRRGEGGDGDGGKGKGREEKREWVSFEGEVERVDTPTTGFQRDSGDDGQDGGRRNGYASETLMETFTEAGVHSSLSLCRSLPPSAITPATAVWPPLRFPSKTRVRNLSGSNFHNRGHRPRSHAEVSQETFRLRKWAQYTGRHHSARTQNASMMVRNPATGTFQHLAQHLGLTTPYFGFDNLLSQPQKPAVHSGTSGGYGYHYGSGGSSSGMSVQIPESVSTFAALPESCYIPTAAKPWQGIWVGDYSGHGCEFLVVMQRDEREAGPLPKGMEKWAGYFAGRGRGDVREEEGGEGDEEGEGSESGVDGIGGVVRDRAGAGPSASGNGSGSGSGSWTGRAIAEIAALINAGHVAPDTDTDTDTDDSDDGGALTPMSTTASISFAHTEAAPTSTEPATPDSDTAGQAAEPSANTATTGPSSILSDGSIEPSGRLEAIKLTGDPNIPRGEYTFIAPDIGAAGFERVADEEIFKGARVVRSAGHIAGRGFMEDQYTPSQLTMISHDRLAQYWEGFGHISYYQRVDIDKLMASGGPAS